MHYVEINKEQWPEHCESFGLQHHGWLVTVRRVTTADLEEGRDMAITAAEPLAVEAISAAKPFRYREAPKQ